MNPEEFKASLAAKGIVLTPVQEQQFARYFALLVEWNEKMNLTAITEEKEVYLKHFYDSIMLGLALQLDENAKLCDVGSGAGFPSIPLKILRPDIKFVLVDSLNKRVNILNELIKILNLQDVVAVHARAEDYIKDNREKFDYAVARAVAPLNTLLEYLVPYVKVGGECLIYKSQKLEDEIETSQNALKVLGCKVEKIENFNIDEIDAVRKVLIIKKCFVTPIKYPRGKNLPKTKPI